MALPNLADIPKTVSKLTNKLGSIEKKVENFAKDGAKGAAAAATAAAATAVKPVKLAVAKVAKDVGAVKQWVAGKINDVMKKVVELSGKMAELERRMNPLTPIAAQATLIATHEPRLKKIEGMDRITDTKLERAAGKTAKLEAEVRELKNAIKDLKKEVEALSRK